MQKLKLTETDYTNHKGEKLVVCGMCNGKGSYLYNNVKDDVIKGNVVAKAGYAKIKCEVCGGTGMQKV